MWAGRRPGSLLALDRLGPAARWLGAGPMAIDERAGDRRLGVGEALAALRRARVTGVVELARVWALMLGEGLADGLGRAEPEQWEAIEDALRRGKLLVFERPRVIAQLDHRLAIADSSSGEGIERVEDIEDGPSTQVLEIRVVEPNERPVAGLPVELTLADGSTRELDSDGGGWLRIPAAPRGAGSVALRPLAELDRGLDWDREGDPDERADWDARWEAEDQRGVELRLDLRGELLGGPGSAIRIETGPRNWVVLARPVLRFVVPDFLRFDHASTLLVPAPWTEERHPLAGIVHALVALLERRDRWLLVVGHASAPGSAAGNQALSEHRADVVRALIEDDGAAWVEHARERGSLCEVLAYLDYLGRRRGWSCAPDQPVESLGTEASAASEAAVSSFQAEYNARFCPSEGGEGSELLVDGVCGVETLRAVFTVVRDELERWLAKLGTSPAKLPLDRVVYRGHGASLAGAEGAEAEAGDRRVDLILIDRLPLSEALELDELYEGEVAWRLPFELPDEPDEWATGPLTIVSDLTPDEPAERETYRLRSDDGAVAFEHVLPDEGEVEAGELVIRYEALPTDRRYSLTVVAANGNHSVIFEDLAYGALHGAPPRAD